MAKRSSSSSGSRSAGKVHSISRGNRSGSRSNSGQGKIDNVIYDVIAVLHEKSQGLEAYDQYLRDAKDNEEVRELMEEIREQDEEAVQNLMRCLRNMMGGEREEEEEEAA